MTVTMKPFGIKRKSKIVRTRILTKKMKNIGDSSRIPENSNFHERKQHKKTLNNWFKMEIQTGLTFDSIRFHNNSLTSQ